MRPRLRVLALAVASLWVVALILMAPSYSQLSSLIRPSPHTSGLGTLRRLEQRPPQQPPPHQPSPLPRPQPPRQPPVSTFSHPSSLLPVPTPRTTACTETGCECAWATADNCKTNDGSVCHKECCCKLTRDVAPPAKATSAVVEAILISPRTRTSRSGLATASFGVATEKAPGAVKAPGTEGGGELGVKRPPLRPQ